MAVSSSTTTSKVEQLNENDAEAEIWFCNKHADNLST